MKNRLTRRRFLDRALSLGAVGITAAGLCVCALSGCVGKDRTPTIPANCIEIKEDRIVVHLSKTNLLKEVGRAAKLSHPKRDKPIIVVHSAAAEYVALSALCTHRGRALEYHPTSKQLRCINFGHSRFGLDGLVLYGPARGSLTVYRTLFIGETLEIFV